MKTDINTIQKYSPKSLQGALALFFQTNFPVIASDVVLPHIVEAIIELINKYLPKTENMKPGETFIIGVHKDEKPGCRKSLYETEMTTGVVELFTDEDIMKKNEGVKSRELKKIKTERIIHQAYAQNIVLSNNDLANLMTVSAGTIGKYIKEIENEKDCLLPTRAVIHDLGPKITHKLWIIKKHFLDKKTIKQVMSETHHSEQAITRYINDFKRVNLLFKKYSYKVDPLEIAKAVGLSLHLVQEYIKISNELVEVYNG